jgi:hypothetical protein
MFPSLHQRAERRNQAQWPSSHLVIIGLLVYIAAFQTVVTTSHRQSDSQLMGDKITSALWESLEESRTPPVSSLPTKTTTKVAKVLPVHDVPTNTPAKAAKVLPVDAIPWRRQSPVELEIAYPIFVTGLPKTGTTSVFKFFRCGGVRSSHAWGTKPGAEKPTLVGQCIQANILHGHPPFEGCGKYDLFSDTGVSYLSRVAVLVSGKVFCCDGSQPGRSFNLLYSSLSSTIMMWASSASFLR